MQDVDNEFIEGIAGQTEGFSGRELFKLVVAWHDAAFSRPDPVLTQDLMSEILDKFLRQHELKATWSKEEAKLMEKII
jgi:ATPase family AAA domain-containing protein 3A/B